MEYILIALFGGGIADWKDIAQTKYDWSTIFDMAKTQFGLDNTDINTLYHIILTIALEDLEVAMQNYSGEKSQEFEKCSNDIFNYFDIWCNCLDTKLSFIKDEELGKEIQEKLQNDIDIIDDKIGFAYISFE